MTPSDAIRHARVLIEHGDRKRAAKLLNRVLETRPRTIEAWALMSTIVTSDADKLRCAERIAALSAQTEVVFGADEVPQPADVSEGGGLHAPAKRSRPSKKEAAAAEAALSNLPSGPVLVAISMGVAALGAAGFAAYTVNQLTRETKVLKAGFEGDTPEDAAPAVDAAPPADPAVVTRIDELEAKVNRLTAELDDLTRRIETPQPGDTVEVSSAVPADDRLGLAGG